MRIAQLSLRAALAALPVGLAAPALAQGTPAPSASAAPEKKGPPFADAKPDAAQAPKPDRRVWNVVQESESGKFAYSFEMKPGVPDPEQVTEILINANAIPLKRDPEFGNNVPLIDARIVIEVTNPAGQLVGRYLSHAVPLTKGRYGLHFTPSQEGLYTLTLKGKTAKGEALSAELKLPVKVWPLPAELEGTGAAGAGSGRRGPISGK